MPKLVINPGTPQVRQIELKAGANTLGRGEANDFKIDDPSVSGYHCRITVENGNTTITDLASSNGTFVNQSPVREAKLQPGQTLRLGGFEMLFVADTPAQPPSVRMRAPLPTPPNLAVAVEEAVDPVPPIESVTPSETVYCKSHLKSPAQWMCRKCNKCFCSLCVGTRRMGNVQHHLCRACGSECVPLKMQTLAQSERGFFARLPGAFAYPFRGMGLLILICAALAFAALGFISTWRGPIFVIVVKLIVNIIIYGFLFLFMQNIIQTTTSDENEPLCFPSPGSLLGAAFQLAATTAASFGVAIVLLVAMLFSVPVPGAAIIASVVLGCFYFPMAFLAVAMKDSVIAANPMVVIPAILKIPFEYLITAILLMGVFGIRELGNMMSGLAQDVSFSTRSMSVLFIALGMQLAWAFASIYLLTVSMRTLGLLYITKKQKLGWFNY